MSYYRAFESQDTSSAVNGYTCSPAEIAREIEFCECQFVTIVIDIVHDSAISVRRHVCHPPEQALQFATSQPTGEASNSRLCRPAEEPASEWFGSLMRFQFRTSGIGASCGG